MLYTSTDYGLRLHFVSISSRDLIRSRVRVVLIRRANVERYEIFDYCAMTAAAECAVYHSYVSVTLAYREQSATNNNCKSYWDVGKRDGGKKLKKIPYRIILTRRILNEWCQCDFNAHMSRLSVRMH